MKLQYAIASVSIQGDNRFTGKLVKVTVDTKPTNLSEADKKAVGDGEEVAAAAEE